MNLPAEKIVDISMKLRAVRAILSFVEASIEPIRIASISH